MLDHSRAYIAGRADRCEAHKERVIALLPRDLTDPAQPVLMLVFGNHADLRGARLAAHGEAGIGDALSISRAALLINDRIHPVKNEGEHLRADAKFREVGWHPVATRHL